MNIEIEWPEELRRKLWIVREEILIYGYSTLRFTKAEEELINIMLQKAITDARRHTADILIDSA